MKLSVVAKTDMFLSKPIDRLHSINCLILSIATVLRRVSCLSRALTVINIECFCKCSSYALDVIHICPPIQGGTITCPIFSSVLHINPRCSTNLFYRHVPKIVVVVFLMACSGVWRHLPVFAILQMSVFVFSLSNNTTKRLGKYHLFGLVR